MNLLDILDRPIAFHRPLVTITGSVNAALMLSQAIYWSRRTTEKDGWFYKTRDDWQQETGLSHEEQETARKKLLKAGVWEERRERLVHRVWYRVNSGELSRVLKSRLPETGNPGVGTPGNRHSTNSKTTSETTTRGSSTLELNGVGSDDAETIYSLYPKHVGKPASIKAIRKQLKSFSAPFLIDRTKAFSAARKGNIEFIPNPATWFNQHRFNDDPSTWAPSQQNSRFSSARPSPPPAYHGPKGWEQWLESKPEYFSKMQGRPFAQLPEFMQLECVRELNAISNAR